MNPQPPLDLVTVTIALVTAIVGPKAAAMVGPYMVIFLGAMLGGAWSTSRHEPATRLAGFVSLISIVGLAIFITVPAAMLLASYFPLLEVRWTLGPVAAIIGGIGQDWPRVFKWAADLFRGIVERWAASRGGNNNG